MSVQPTQIQKALDWRYAVKKFDPNKKISAADWQVLSDALLKAPSSYGLQPYRFLLINKPEIRNELKAASWNQTQVTESSHFVVFLYKEKMEEKDVQKYIDRVAAVRNIPSSSLEGYKGMMVGDVVKGPRSAIADVWSSRQAYITIGFLLETAALLSIDACPMEGLDPSAYDKILKLNGTGWKTVAAVALGYRHSEDSTQSYAKVRMPSEEMLQTI